MHAPWRQKTTPTSVKRPMMPTHPAYVLYLEPTLNLLNQTLLKSIQPHHKDVFKLQIVTKMKERPPWLNGVPILADTKLGLIYRGTDCVTMTKKLLSNYIPPPPLQTPPVHMEHAPKKPAEREVPKDIFHDAEETKDTMDYKKGSKFSESALSQMIAKRNLQVKNIPNLQRK